jgi:hypothetical protein
MSRISRGGYKRNRRAFGQGRGLDWRPGCGRVGRVRGNEAFCASRAGDRAAHITLRCPYPRMAMGATKTELHSHNLDRLLNLGQPQRPAPACAFSIAGAVETSLANTDGPILLLGTPASAWAALPEAIRRAITVMVEVGRPGKPLAIVTHFLARQRLDTRIMPRGYWRHGHDRRDGRRTGAEADAAKNTGTYNERTRDTDKRWLEQRHR